METFPISQTVKNNQFYIFEILYSILLSMYLVMSGYLYILKWVLTVDPEYVGSLIGTKNTDTKVDWKLFDKGDRFLIIFVFR